MTPPIPREPAAPNPENRAPTSIDPAGSQPWLQQRCAERVGAFQVTNNIELRAPWTALFGPSGSGKSTWLRMLTGLAPQRTGTLLLHGEEMRHRPTHRRRIALVEQSPALFPHLSVEQNLTFAAAASRSATAPGNLAISAETRATAHPGLFTFPAGDTGAPTISRAMLEALFADFHLVPLRRARIATLSGGERQRVALARALCSHPRALLLDEVFTGMDSALRTDLIAALQQWQHRLRLPILSVTHDVTEVFATATEVLRMQNGAITDQGSPAAVLATEREDLLNRLGSSPRGA